MKAKDFFTFSRFGLSTIILKRKAPILGTIIITDKCNLSCRHCAVNNIHSEIYSYEKIFEEMKLLYKQGIRILFFCGGETFLWSDKGKTVRDLVIEAKEMGFLLVNVVTNGTFPIQLPEADLILLSLDGNRESHNLIRGETYDLILHNIRNAASDNICLYMAINQINRSDIPQVCRVAVEEKHVRAVSFNFHTPYPGTETLALSREEKAFCCKIIEKMMEEHVPVFNLKSAFPCIINNDFPTPCRQCVVMENGRVSVCGRCIEVPGLCQKCGYFFAAEYSLIFKGRIGVIWDMLKTYLRYI